MSAAVRRSPAHWACWASRADLAGLGLIPPEPDGAAVEPDGAAVEPDGAAVEPDGAAVEPVLLKDGGFTRDGSADNVAAQS